MYKNVKKDKIKMYHVTLDLGVGEKVFSPRVPKNICKGEDSSIKRVCVSETIEDAISGFPYKDYIVNKYKSKNRFLSVYEIEVCKEDVMFSESLSKYVPDAHISKECWITKDVVGVGRIINVKDIVLSKYNKYANYYSGRVVGLEYEELNNLYDSKLEILIPTVEEYEKLTNIMHKLNIKYNILDSGKNKFYKSIDGYFAGMTDEEYDWWNIKIYIPSCLDSVEFWSLIANIDRHYIDIPGDYCKSGFDIEDDLDEISEYDIDYSIKNANKNIEKKYEDRYIKSLSSKELINLIKNEIKLMYSNEEYSLQVAELAFDKLKKEID